MPEPSFLRGLSGFAAAPMPARAPSGEPQPSPAPVSAQEPPRLTIALTFDHDAISSAVERGLGPFDRSIGEFGVRVGVPRILDLLRRLGVRATFFVPAHTARTFPASVAAIAASGHELGCHGWAHEDLAGMDEPAERDVILRSRDAIGAAWGVAPAGFRAPDWSLSERTLAIVEESGFAYDSSLAWDDFRLDRIRHGDAHSVEGSVLGHAGRLVEVPISHQLDDWPHFQPSRGGSGSAAPSAVEEIWLGELRYAHAHAPGGVVTYTMHPECIGRGGRIAMLERVLRAALEMPGVAFDRLDAIVERWAAVHPAPEG